MNDLINNIINENKRLQDIINKQEVEIIQLKNKLEKTEKPTKIYQKHIKEIYIPIENEIWKENESYPNILISNLGRVREKGNVYLCNQYKTSAKYKEVCVIDKNKRIKSINVHRLVAETFIENPLNLPEIDHINTIRDDNNVSNLKWCWALENILLNDITFNKIKDKNNLCKLTIKRAIERDKKYSIKTNIEINYPQEIYKRLKLVNYNFQ